MQVKNGERRRSLIAGLLVLAALAACGGGGGPAGANPPAPDPTPAPAVAYYVDDDAPDDSGNGSATSPKKYISSGAALLSSAGGQTLLIKPGRYTNAKDKITSTGGGKAGAWNVIKAESDGTVVITAGMDLGLGDHYLQFEGLVFDSPTTKSINGRYVKVLRSAFKGGPPTNNTMNLAIGTNDATPGAQYVLVEDAYVYGPGGRYSVLVYNSDKVVLRRLVVRHEDGWSDTKGDPQAAVSLYNSQNVLTQNLMIVDSGASGYFEAALYHPSNSSTWPSRNIQHVGAMILNTSGTAVGWDDSVASTGNLLQDSVIWKARSAVSINGAAHAGLLDRVTIGSTSGGLNDWSGSGRFNVQNSLLWGVNNNSFRSISHSGNVCFSPTCSGESALDPTAALLWLPKVEAGSALSTAGLGGSQVGATVLKRLGVSGTLWGDPGYDQITSQSLWPWPNEAAIQKAMCTDMGITTGLGAKASLTAYVWEMLGNKVPVSF